jgi:isopenicillin N synthase-like dioxygenase
MDDSAPARAGEVRLSAIGELPVLDLGPFLADEPGALEKLSAEVRDACERIGFFFIRNHGIAEDLIARQFEQSKRFHDQPMAAKTALAVDQNQRGYIQPGGTLIKHSTYNKNTKFDSNAVMVFATEYGPDHPQHQAGKRYFGENQWPDNMPGFRETITEYMNTLTALGKRMLPVWAEALDLPQDFFTPYFRENYTYFRMSHYPPTPELGENEFGLGPHADTGFMTFLPQAAVDGLEILDTDGNWFRPPRMDDAILVNTGQFLGRWSNERFRATPHRVIPPKDTHRYSAAVFVNNDFEPVCECLPTCHDAENPPRYPAESYWDFYNWYMTNTYPHFDEFHDEDPE